MTTLARVLCSVKIWEETMARISRRTVVSGLAAAALLPSARSGMAQGYPGSQTIKMVVPYPAGGATDVIGRIVADRLQAMWRTTVIVENISGAAGSIGMDRIAKGPTDGTPDSDGAAADLDQPVPVRQARLRSRKRPGPDRAGCRACPTFWS